MSRLLGGSRYALGAAAYGAWTGFAAATCHPVHDQKKPRVLAAVEGGGTSWRVALAHDDPTNIVEIAEFATSTPAETIAAVKAWLDKRRFDALGVAMFGPIDLHTESKTYGYITTTPKTLWKNTDVLGPLRAGIESLPFGFDTDVNAPAMAEFALSRREGESSCAYVTVGTGIGVGLVVNGECVHGMMHPEGGHMCTPANPADCMGTVNNTAPFGGFSVESMANSKAIAARAGVATSQLAKIGDDHPVWDHTATYLASLCVNMILLVSPERIVLSGGVMNREILFPKIRSKVQEMLNGYIDMPQITTDAINEYIVPSKHGNNIGIIGALALAQTALDQQK